MLRLLVLTVGVELLAEFTDSGLVVADQLRETEMCQSSCLVVNADRFQRRVAHLPPVPTLRECDLTERQDISVVGAITYNLLSGKTGDRENKDAVL